MRTKVVYFILGLTTLLGSAISNTALSKDYDGRIALDAISRQEGLGKETVQLLERAPGRGHSVVASEIVDKFLNKSAAISTDDDWETEVDDKDSVIFGNG